MVETRGKAGNNIETGNGHLNVRCVAGAVALLAAAAVAQAAAINPADAYPSKPIRVIVLNAPGSGADIVTRLVAHQMTEAWGQQVIVDNRAGATGNIGAEIAARAAPDGYTLVMITSQQPIVAAMFDKLSYDLIRDFSPISLLGQAPFFMVVHPAVPATSVRDLIALAKAKPGQLHYGSAGPGSSPHMATEIFKHMTGTDLVHVPYKGTSPVLTATISAQVQVAMLVAALVLPMAKAGKVRALAVTSLKRSQLAPDMPTVAETVAGYEWTGWYGLAAPAGTPGAIIAKINAEQNRAIKLAEFRERLVGVGAEPSGSTPREYALHLRTQMEKMRHAIKVSGARPD